jgi:hypothetical protein
LMRDACQEVWPLLGSAEHKWCTLESLYWCLHSLPESRAAVRQQKITWYHCCCHIWLGLRWSKEEGTGWWQFGAYRMGSRSWRFSRLEGYHRLQSRMLDLLSPVKHLIPRDSVLERHERQLTDIVGQPE